MATAAAPTYLRAHRLERGRVRLIDGGVWANNPAVVGIAEAISVLGANVDGIRGTEPGDDHGPPAQVGTT